jgi:hypothetical protein
MLSLEMRRTLKTTAVVLALCGLALPAAFAQTESSPAAHDPLQETIGRIQEIQSLEGGDSPLLIEPLTALAVLYEESGDGALAIAAIERARRLVRVTHGLYSLDEAPLLRQLLVKERAAGNAEAAWKIEQDLLTLVAKNPGRLRTVPILRDIGDGRADVLRRYLAGQLPPEIVLGCYYNRGHSLEGSCRAGSRGVVKTSLLMETQSYYARAIRTVQGHDGYRSEELPDLWMSCVRTAYEFRGPSREWLFVDQHGVGASCLRGLANYAVKNSHPLPAQMDAIVQLADWGLLFTRDRDSLAAALAGYEQTYAMFAQRGLDAASIARLFSPETPVVLPTFWPTPLASAEPVEPAGHVDFAFDITKYGKSERIEILAATPDVTAADQDRLVELIERSRFRPRTTDGRFADASRVVVRYFLSGDQPR